MRTVIIGAGAVGLGLGACLLRAGTKVAFAVRPGGSPGPRRGLRLSGVFGEAIFPAGACDVFESAEAAGAAAADFVLVCTKTFDAERAAAELEAAGGSAPVVLAHNGWGSADRVAARLGRARVFNARVITGFRRGPDPGEVRITVHADDVKLGSLYGADPGRVAPLVDALARGGMPASLSADVSRDLWAKLLYNCALNPLGALLGVRYGVLAERRWTREIMDAVIDEVFVAMACAGRRTHWPDAEHYRPVFYDELLPPTADHESSMLQDLRAGRRTEIDALCGAVVDACAAGGREAPCNRALRDLVRTAERA